ncbi:hypothetical protein L1S32_02215 [Methanogenium sp. S4BF]|uniref:hypothetical protein n=1 Tax=Methanogenium sp. S4BF TaxID=1789226 RepID=UPI002417C205|nr:hypothetical protein [Methanogenium sp. S4BF]WFN34956.1 hypothetical protein L1S32_02215 [Methanogenium sp. S4BF]
MYTRDASSLDLFTDSIRLMGDATLCGVMEFDQSLAPDALEQASLACLMAHPVLHSRLVRGNGPAVWELVDDVRIPPVRVEECPDNYHSHVIGPVDPYGPLQFRVRLLRRPSGDVIVINLAHAAADAFGLHTLMSQLLQEYQTPGSIRPAQGEIPARDTLWTRSIELQGTPESPDMNVINPMWPDPFGTSREPSDFHRECISSPVMETIRTRVKAFGGSINDAVIAAYFLSMSDLTGHMGPINVFFPVNLRRYKNDGSRVMSNQAANVCITLDRRAGEGMEEILPRVIRETKLLKKKAIGISEQVFMDMACDPEGRQIHRMAEEMAALQRSGFADIFVSNPGPVSLPDMEGLTDAYVCYPGCYMPCTCFITSTFRGQMTVTMGYQDSERAREGTRKAITLFRKYLLLQ